MTDNNMDLRHPSSSDTSPQSLSLSHLQLMLMHSPLVHLNWVSGSHTTGAIIEVENNFRINMFARKVEITKYKFLNHSKKKKAVFAIDIFSMAFYDLFFTILNIYIYFRN